MTTRFSEKDRTKRVISLLKKNYSNPHTALNYDSPFQLLVATILSAQCTDKRVNLVTPSLFKKYRTPYEFASVDPEALANDINSINFFRNKAKSIVNCARQLVERHGGMVPKSMKELTDLSGVGRKTANCVLGGAFGIAEGIVVDTHVLRLANRLGFSKSQDPEKVEKDLMETFPKKGWIDLSNLFILHGRSTCKAINPKCPECILKEICPSANI